MESPEAKNQATQTINQEIPNQVKVHSLASQPKLESIEKEENRSTESFKAEATIQAPVVTSNDQKQNLENESKFFPPKYTESKAEITDTPKSNNVGDERIVPEQSALLSPSNDGDQHQDDENNESEIPLSAMLTSADQKCVVCNENLSNLSYLEREKHVNSCLDFELSKSTLQPYRCSICGKDISKYNEVRRQQHMNRCCDQSDTQTNSSRQRQDSGPPTAASEEHIHHNSLVDAKWFCFVCKKDFSALKLKSRINHLKGCAKKYKVGPKQLKLLQEEYAKQSDDKQPTSTTTDSSLTFNQIPNVPSKRKSTSDANSSTKTVKRMKSKSKRTPQKNATVMDVSPLGLSSPSQPTKTPREQRKSSSRRSTGAKNRTPLTTSTYFDQTKKIDKSNENEEQNDDFLTPIKYRDNTATDQSKNRNREENMKEDEDMMLALALSASEAEHFGHCRSLETENSPVNKSKQLNAINSADDLRDHTKYDTLTPPLPESALPQKYSSTTIDLKKHTDTSEAIRSRCSTSTETLSLWRLQSIDASDLSQSIFHTDVIPLSQRLYAKRKCDSTRSDQLQLSFAHDSDDTIPETIADTAHCSSSKSSPVSPLKLTQAAVSPLPPEKNNSMTKSKDGVSTSTLVEMSQKRLQEQEDELNQMLDELEEGIQLSQQYERMHSQDTNHKREGHSEGWLHVSLVSNGSQRLDDKQPIDNRDTDYRPGHKLQQRRLDDESNSKFSSHTDVDKSFERSVIHHPNKIATGPEYFEGNGELSQIEDDIRLIEERYQRRYIETLEAYRQKVYILRNELYCEIGKLTLTKNRLVSRLRLLRKRNQQTHSVQNSSNVTSPNSISNHQHT
jgi:hypothetical protein